MLGAGSPLQAVLLAGGAALVLVALVCRRR